MTRSLEALRWESALISSCSTAISSPPTLRQSKIRRWLLPISMDVWSIPLSPAARPKTPSTTRRTRSPGGGGTSAKRACASGYTATELSLGGAKAHYDGIVAFSQTDFTEDLKKIAAPVLVIHSEDDQIVPYAAAGPLAAKLLRNGTLKTYKDYPHGMITTQAEAINADLLAFLKA